MSASGYAHVPRDFDELCQILGTEVLLITPTGRLELSTTNHEEPTKPVERYYQLTHDYLVPSIREWVARKQLETRRGRAELRLARHSSLWNSKRENRHLPSALEWVQIRLLTKSRDWTEPERRMMSDAWRFYALRTLAALILLGLLTLGGVGSYGTLRATSLVDSLRTARTTDVPALVRQLDGYRHWANPRLNALVQSAGENSREKLNASLALLPVDPSHLLFLEKRLLSADPADVPVIRDALEPYRATLVPKLWTLLASAKPVDVSLVRVASALARYAPDDPRWEAESGKVAQALVSVNSIYLGDWLKYFSDVRNKLTAPLATIFRDRKRSESEREQATDILTVYASGDPDLIADLLMDSDIMAYAAFFPIAQRHEAKTLPLFQAEILKEPSYLWNDPPLDPSWTTSDPTLTGKIESAQGMLTERFAFCQTMPLDEYVKVAEALRHSGYRPTRFRPSTDGKTLRVAVVWTRDGLPWRIVRNRSADEIRQTDERSRKEGYLPVDVAGYLPVGQKEGNPTSRFAALWALRTVPDNDARIDLASSAAEVTKLQEQLRSAGRVLLTLNAWRQVDDQVGYCGVSNRTATGSLGTPVSQTGLLESVLAEMIAQDTGTLIDLHVFAAPPPPSTKERATLALQAAEAAFKAMPDDLNTRLARGSAYFQLSESQKAIDDLDAVIQKAPQVVVAHQFRAIAHARLGHKEEAKADLKRFQERDSTDSSKLYVSVIISAELGEGLNEAVGALEAALRRKPQDSGLQYDAACAYAMASRMIARMDQARSQSLSERALSLLRKAIENGYADYGHMQEDADLDPIRDLPAFAEIMKPLRLDRSYSAVWTGDVQFEANPLFGLNPITHLQRCRELVTQGYRIGSLSVAQTSPEGPPNTASVWHRPVITEETKDRLAERQARAAVALLRMGKVAEFMLSLRHSADAGLRSLIIIWVCVLGVDPLSLSAEFERPSTHRQADPC